MKRRAADKIWRFVRFLRVVDAGKLAGSFYHRDFGNRGRGQEAKGKRGREGNGELARGN